MRRRPLRIGGDGVLAATLGLLAFVLLLTTEPAVGFVRDESVYFAAGEQYAAWVMRALEEPSLTSRDAAIARSFDFNREHPALFKLLFGLSHRLFFETLHWTRPATAFRLPAMACAALIPLVLFLFGRRLFRSRTAGLFAALSFLAVPRQFFHAHLACFDVPIAAMWLFTVYAFWRGQERARWAWACGLFFGLALATKHNAFFLPVVLAPFALGRAWARTKAEPSGRERLIELLAALAGVAALGGVLIIAQGPRFLEHLAPLSPATALALLLLATGGGLLARLRAASPGAADALRPIAAMAVLGPLVLYAHWPFLWHHPLERVAWWMRFHATHNHYAWMYLGELLREPPFPLLYVFVVTALTVPVTLLLPMALGLGGVIVEAVRARRPPSWEMLLLVANALASILLISHPNVPHFGGVKHWFPSMPFLALLGGFAVARAAAAVPRLRRIPREATTAMLVVGLLLPAVIAGARAHPYGTSVYGELAGGIPGAASLGMQRQFWSNNVTGVLDWLNGHAPRGAHVYLHEVNGYSIRDYQRNGMLRSDLRPVSEPDGADFAAYQYHQEFREQELEIWRHFGTTRPVTGLYLDETPQVVVYARRRNEP